MPRKLAGPRSQIMAKLDRAPQYALLHSKGYTVPQALRELGFPLHRSGELYVWAKVNGLSWAHPEPAQPRSQIDNALRAAFRTVLGFDPMRDGAPPNPKNPPFFVPDKVRCSLNDEIPLLALSASSGRASRGQDG